MSRSDAARGRSDAPLRRRAPTQDERRRDPERSRQRILDAALTEFSAKGFAGARVAEIAALAGVNSQLITYYFGGKNGLYDALRDMWESTESAFATPDQSFAALIGTYFDAVADHASWARLLIWEALGDGSEHAASSLRASALSSLVESIRRRQAAGELTEEFDAEVIATVLWSAVMAPVTMSEVIQKALGADLRSVGFRARYAEQLKRLFAGPQAELPLCGGCPDLRCPRVRLGGTPARSTVKCPLAAG